MYMVSYCNDCNLTDIQLEVHRFTWIKSRGTTHVIKERLDKAIEIPVVSYRCAA
jgi:hypothetical protein